MRGHFNTGTTRQIADEALLRSRANDSPGDNVVLQSDYWIDAVHGNDDNPATQSKPIKTFKELTQRFGLYNTVTPKTGSQFTIHLLSDIPPSDPFRLHTILAKAVTLVVQGGVKHVIHSGTVTGVTAINEDMNQPYEMTDAAVPVNFWQNNRGQRVTITSGAGQGSQAWPLKDLGAGKARMSTWMADIVGQPGLQLPSTPPGIGDHYHVEQLYGMTIASDDDVRSEVVGAGGFAVGAEAFIDIELQPPGLSIFGANIEVDVGNPTTGVGFGKCRIVPFTFDRSDISNFNSGSQWVNCCFLDSQIANGRTIVGGAAIMGTIAAAQFPTGFPAYGMQGGANIITADFIFQGDQANGIDASVNAQQGRLFPETMAFFDSIETITMTDATAVVRWASFTLGVVQKFWGSNNAAPVFLFRGCTFSFQQPENSPVVPSPPGGPPTINIPTIQNSSGFDWSGNTDGLNPTGTSVYFDNPTSTFLPVGGIASLWANLAVAQPAGFATIAGPIPDPPGNDFFYGASAIDPSNQDIVQWNESTHVPP